MERRVIRAHEARVWISPHAGLVPAQAAIRTRNKIQKMIGQQRTNLADVHYIVLNLETKIAKGQGTRKQRGPTLTPLGKRI